MANNIINNSTKKKEIKKKLIYTRDALNREFKNLYKYQLSFFCLYNFHKDIAEPSTKVIPFKEIYGRVSEFGQYRNDFLNQKIETIRTYVTTITKVINQLDYITLENYKEIDHYLRFMLLSVGIRISNNIFEEPF